MRMGITFLKLFFPNHEKERMEFRYELKRAQAHTDDLRIHLKKLLNGRREVLDAVDTALPLGRVHNKSNG